MKEWLVVIESPKGSWKPWHAREGAVIKAAELNTLEHCLERAIRRTRRFMSLRQYYRTLIVNWNTGEIIPSEALGV